MNPASTPAGTRAPLSELEQKIEELVGRVVASRHEDLEALRELTELLPDSDGVPLESPWHFDAIALLKDVLTWHWRDRNDFFVGGNMFVYYNIHRLLNQDFRGPDFFYVSGVDRHTPRTKWVIWEEGKLPGLIIEFLSPSTAQVDRTAKKQLYEEVWQTGEYFCYDPDLGRLEGWRLDLDTERYRVIPADERGWLWSGKLGLWLGKWSGEFHGLQSTWLRPYDAEGRLVLHRGEAEAARAEAEHRRAEQERQRAETERERAEAAERRAEQERARAAAVEEEVARLKARVAELESGGPGPPAPA